MIGNCFRVGVFLFFVVVLLGNLALICDQAGRQRVNLEKENKELRERIQELESGR